MASASFLLLCTVSLWMLQTTAPAFQPYFPYLNITWGDTSLQVPFFQILAGLAGLLSYLCAYCLLHQCSGGKVSLQSNLLFVLFGYMTTYGHGMHAVCVMVEEKGANSVSPSMAVYVDFLHEVISHNMFVCGFYAMMVLIMKAEKDSFDYKLQKKIEKRTGATANGHIDGPISSKIATSSNIAMSSVTFHSSASTVHKFLLQWTWPAIVGAYFSIFSAMTGTTAITVMFYILIYIYTVLSCQKLDSNGIPIVGALLDSELLVWATITKAACVGLPALGVWLWC